MRVVVKLGGGSVHDAGLAAVARDVASLLAEGHTLMVVHGGGEQTSALQRALGQTPRQIAGRRVTDEPALAALEMALGKLDVDICAAFLAAGVRPVGLHGASSLVIEARRRPPRVYAGAGDEPVDLGLVGDVVGVNRDLLERLLDGGYLPVLACIGADPEGNVYNINADVVANRLAIEVGADALVLVTGVAGVRADLADPHSRIPTLSRAQADAAIAGGTVSAGMIPKLEESLSTIAAGVGRVHIVGELRAGDLVAELRQPGSIGTALTP